MEGKEEVAGEESEVGCEGARCGAVPSSFGFGLFWPGGPVWRGSAWLVGFPGRGNGVHDAYVRAVKGFEWDAKEMQIQCNYSFSLSFPLPL